MAILERESVPKEAIKCSAAQGPHSEVVPHAFWRLVSKSCDDCKGSFARGCEAKQWSYWACSPLGTIFQPMRINSVPDFKCFCNNKNMLYVQSMVWHFVRHPVFQTIFYFWTYSPSKTFHIYIYIYNLFLKLFMYLYIYRTRSSWIICEVVTCLYAYVAYN